MALNSRGFRTLQTRRVKQLCIARLSLMSRDHSRASLSKTNSKSFKTLLDIPGPRRLPLISFAKDVLSLRDPASTEKLFLKMYETNKRYGDLAKFHILAKTFIIVSNPHVAEEICRIEGAVPSREKHFKESLSALREARAKFDISPGLSSAEAEEWVRIRGILSKRFLRPMELKNYFDGFSSCAERLVEDIRQQRDGHNEIADLRESLQHWAVESTSAFIFGERIALLSNNGDKFAENLFEVLKEYFQMTNELSIHPITKILYPRKHKKFEELTLYLRDEGARLTGHIIKRLKEEAKDGKSDAPIGKSLVAYLTLKDNLSYEEVFTTCIDMTFAGFDTTSSSAIWLLHALGNNPAAQERLFEEINTVASNDDLLTYNDTQRMPYLRACLKESQRLNPTAALVPRIFDHEVKAGGYTFPADTFFLISNYNMARSEKLFPEPLAFKPERWIRKGKMKAEDLPNAFSSLPFGFGPRSCIGRRLAESSIQAMAVNVIKNFKLRYIGEPQIGRQTPVFLQDKPARMIVEER